MYPEGIILFSEVNLQFFSRTPETDIAGDAQTTDITTAEFAGVSLIISTVIDDDEIFTLTTADVRCTSNEIDPAQGGRIQTKGRSLHSNGVIPLAGVDIQGGEFHTIYEETICTTPQVNFSNFSS